MVISGVDTGYTSRFLERAADTDLEKQIYFNKGNPAEYLQRKVGDTLLMNNVLIDHTVIA